MRAGEIIKTGDIDIKVTHIIRTSGNSVWADGVMRVALLKNSWSRVKLRDVSVNIDMRMLTGTFGTVWDLTTPIRKYEPVDTPAPPESDSPTPTTPLAFNGVDVSVNGDVDTVVYDNATQNIIVTLVNGTTQTITPTIDPATDEVKAVRVTDSNGDRWIVDKNGVVTRAPSVQAPPPVAPAGTVVNFAINFSENENQSGGLDLRDEFTYSQDHTELTINGQPYFAPWKSVEAGALDVVNATASGQQTFPTFVGFKNQNGEITTTPLGSSKTLNIEGSLNLPITAYARMQEGDVEVGRLNVLVLQRINLHVHLVPVNTSSSIDASEVQTTLNKIYKSAAVHWTVTKEPVFNYAADLSTFDEGSSGVVASYNAQMRAFNAAYRQGNANIVGDHFYIFLINGVNTTYKGFMPFKRGFGYIYPDKPGDNARAIAHELGHGAFNLEHPFEEFSVTQGSTPNLMDYGSGTQLKKYQWLKIHDPDRMVGWVQGDEEGAMKPLLKSKYVFMHDQLSTKSYVSNVGANEFMQGGVDYVDSKLFQLDTAEVKTYIYFAFIWFHPGNIDRFDQLIDNSFAHAIDSIKQNLKVKDFNLLAIVNAKFDTALAAGFKTVSFREKFFPMTGLSSNCTKTVQDYLKSSYKKVFVNGLDEALKERADILLQSLKSCEIVLPEEIVIHYKRKGRNTYRTWGEFTIVGTDYRGYVLERDKGPNPGTLETCKRHPPGTYELAYSDSKNGSPKFDGFVMLLKEHTAYKLHGGNRADQSLGCLLINKNSPKLDSYPNAFQSVTEDTCEPQGEPRADNPTKCSVANSWFEHDDPNNPAYQLRKYI